MTSDTTTGTSPDAIELLTGQHREVERLWSGLQTMTGVEPAAASAVGEIIKLLSQHDAIETQLLYPAVREVDGGDELADHSLDEHQRLREMLKEVDRRDISDSTVFIRLGECLQAVIEHVREEEAQIFPRLRAHFPPDRLRELGQTMARALSLAPTHPHPSMPDSPIAGAVAGTITGLIDKARDALQDERDA